MTDSLDARIDDVIDRALAERRIVGTVVLVARGGEIVYARAAGDADRERGLPMAQNTVFRLASVTKPIVAAAALAMIERGDLALDAPVSRWLPDFRPSAPGGAPAEIARPTADPYQWAQLWLPAARGGPLSGGGGLRRSRPARP